jgi:chitodextrinase
VRAENLVANPSFEEQDPAPWNITGVGASVEDDPDASDGARAVKFWAASAYEFSVTQTIEGVPAGSYTLSATSQGDDDGPGDTLLLNAETSTGTVSAPITHDGWRNYTTATVPDVVVGQDGVVTVTATYVLSAGAWGNLDDVRLVLAVDPTQPDVSALEAALAEADGVDRGGFTTASLAALDEASAIGNVILAGSRASQDDVDAVTALVTEALDGLTPIAEWESTTTYRNGDWVRYDGREFLSAWYNRGTVPGASPYGPWQEIATAPDGTAIWTESRIFHRDDVVLHDGATYVAKWWTRNQEPGDPWGPWAPTT